MVEDGIITARNRDSSRAGFLGSVAKNILTTFYSGNESIIASISCVASEFLQQSQNNRQVNHLNSHSAVFLPIRAVIFDIGGVFFPWPQSAFFMQWEARLAIAPGHIHQLLWHGPDIEAANIGAITAEEYCCRCAGRLGVDEVQARALIEIAFSGEHLNDELATYVWLLHSRVHTAALTNTWSFGRRLIERRGITNLFDLIVTSAEEGVNKPQARIYEITLERLDVIAAEAVFIDDTDENVMAARDLGMQSILFHSTEQTIAELEALLAQRGVVRT